MNDLKAVIEPQKIAVDCSGTIARGGDLGRALPSDFDLYCDIKTHEQLTEEWNKAKDRVELLETLMADYDIRVERKTAKKVW